MSCYNFPIRSGVVWGTVYRSTPAAEVGIGTIVKLQRIDSNTLLREMKAKGLPAGAWTLGLYEQNPASGEVLALMPAITAAVTAVSATEADLLSGGAAPNTFDIRYESLHEAWDSILANASAGLDPRITDKHAYKLQSAYFLGLKGAVAVPAATKLEVYAEFVGAGY